VLTEILGESIKKSLTIPVKQWGATVLDQKSRGVDAGTSEFLELNIDKLAKPEFLALSITPGFDKLLTELALEDPLLSQWCFSPYANNHPSGKLIAFVSILEYFHSKNIKQGETYDLILQQAKWSQDELIALVHNGGFWTESTNTNHSDTWTTVYSYIALKKWKNIRPTRELVINKAEEWLKVKFTQLDINNLEERALLQMALAYGEKADFSECNRLQRNSARLTSAAKLFLSQAFILQKRNAIAQQIMGLHVRNGIKHYY